jgi:hypothetical protein
VDASGDSLGATLVNVTDEKEKMIVVLSHIFSDVARRWSTIEKEAYTIFYAIKKLESYFLGHHFILETDHRNLVYIQSVSTPKVQRWLLRMKEFDFDVVHLYLNHIKIEFLHTIELLHAIIHSSHIAGVNNVIPDAISCCFILSVEGMRQRFRCQDSYQKFVFLHNCMVGHHGVHAMMRKIRQLGCEWPNMEKELREFVRNCSICQKTRPEVTPQSQFTLRSLGASRPFDCLSVDFQGPYPEDRQGKKYILVIIDDFLRKI